MVHSTPKVPQPRPDILQYIRAYARSYIPREVVRPVRIWAQAIGEC